MSASIDFDDMARAHGEDAVRLALDEASWPWADEPRMDEPSSTPIISATPFAWRDPATIKRREFLYGFELRRKQVSALVGVGAGGKTTFKVGRAICLATGREFFGHRVWNGPHRVWLWNLEDEMEEVEKAVHGFMKHFGLSVADLGDRLFLDGIDSPSSRFMKLGTGDRGGCTINRPISAALIEEIRGRGIDYLDIDPFVSSHSVDENDNGAIDAVSKEWVRIAHEANCAVSLAHHVRKPNGQEASAFDARGAVAMINAARSVLVLQKMTRDAAQDMAIPECDRKRYVSIHDDKNNKAPPALSAEWYEFISVGLGNEDETGPEDSIGVLQRWQPPNAFAGVTARQLLNIQKLVHAEPAKCRKHSKAQLWVGKLVAYVLDKNLDEPGTKAGIEKMIGTWLATGALRTVSRQNERRETSDYVEVGAWAEVD